MRRFPLSVFLGALLLLSAPARADLSAQERADLSDMMLAEIVKVHGQPEAVPRDQQAAQVFYSLASRAGRQDVHYRLEVVESDTVNAYAMPDGRIVFFTGLLEALPADDVAPLAFVAAHEIAHVEKRHAERLFQKRLATMVFVRLLTRNSEDWVQLLGGFAYNMFASGYSREMEAEADREALAMMQQGDFDPHGALVTLGMFRDAHGGGMRMFPTHPDPADRYKDAVAWVKANDPDSPLVVADLLDRLRAQGREADRVAQGLWSTVSNQPQAAGGADADARVALLGLAESTRGLVDSLDRSVAVPHDAFHRLQEARTTWAAARVLLPLDPERQKQVADLDARLAQVQDGFLLAATRDTERLAQLLWKEGGGARDPGLRGLAESALSLRTGLESGKPAHGAAFQGMLAQGQRWVDSGGPDLVPSARRSEAMALVGELRALETLATSRPSQPAAVEHANVLTCAATLDGLAQGLWAQVRNQPQTPGDDTARRALVGLAETSHNAVQAGVGSAAFQDLPARISEWEGHRAALALTPEQEHAAAMISRESEHLLRALGR